MFLKILTSSFKVFIILFLLFSLIFILYISQQMNSQFQKEFPHGVGIEFFTGLSGLLIPHFIFFTVSFFWLLFAEKFVKKLVKDSVKYSMISFIPIFIFWSLFFIVYVLDCSIPWFYFGDKWHYQPLRAVSSF